ncbi:MAG: 4'-phosphopantetheinyl transferase family protein [Kiritimatiellia bacterium]
MQDYSSFLHPILPDADAIHTVLFSVDSLEKQPVGNLDAWLTASELAEYQAFSNGKRKREWLSSRIALKAALLRDGIIRRPLDVSIRKNPAGAPRLVIYEPDTLRYAEMACSISHSGSYVVVSYALSRKIRIGVDIEHRTWRLMYMRRKFVAPDDQMLDKNDNTGDATVLWTFKEALSKLLGVGWAAGFRSLVCRETSPGFCELTDGMNGSYQGRYCWFGRYAISLVCEIAEKQPNRQPRQKRPLFERLQRFRRLSLLRKRHASNGT